MFDQGTDHVRVVSCATFDTVLAKAEESDLMSLHVCRRPCGRQGGGKKNLRKDDPDSSVFAPLEVEGARLWAAVPRLPMRWNLSTNTGVIVLGKLSGFWIGPPRPGAARSERYR